ncbi:MAG: Gfo/Idh/MocA family oxidoreductase [Spirochaetaceae bacterium]|nr:Gfo/Idh/MocA family oxidoreductase [Spirochaetaceae bacterium]
MTPTAQEVEPVCIGLIGCGKISAAYLQAAPDYPVLDMVACADIDHAAAQRIGAEFGLQVMEVDDLLASDDVEAVLNLTVPAAHAPVNLAALQAGKHVYCEKPFAVDPAAGAEVLAAARERGLRVGSAPDTFLGAGHQTVRTLVDADRIGRVVAASAIWMGHGHEGWHPSPAFFYEQGGGPHFDMGPYYLTALVHALGPVRAVTAMTGRAFETRTVGSGPNAGAVVPVQVDTHLSGTLEFASGCIGTIAMSFDVWRHAHPCLELYGTEGSISAPDPNGFGGPVAVADPGGEWTEVPLAGGPTANARSIGLADMCIGLRSGTPHRCSGDLAQHVLEVMAAFDRSAAERAQIPIDSRPGRPG